MDTLEHTILRDYRGSVDDLIIRQAVDLHHDGLAYRSFITDFGKEFLFGFYQEVLKDRRGFLLLAREGDRVLGSVLASVESDRVMSVFFKRPFFFGRYIFPHLIAHPSAAKKLIESLSYSKVEGVPIRAELLVIVVAEGQRSRGVGASLLRHLDEEFSKVGIHRYKVAVHKEMARSNRFYEKNGMRLARTFTFYGVPWNVYSKDIPPTVPGDGGSE